MKMQTTLPALVLALLLLCGCGASSAAVPASAEASAPVITEPPEESASPESTDPPVTPPPQPDFDMAYGKYAPETTVMTVDGVEINWEKYFGALSQRAMFFWLYYGISDYGALLEDDGETIGDWVREQAEIDLRSLAMLRSWAEELGLGLTEEDYAEIDAELQEQADLYFGGDMDAMFSELGASEEFARFEGEYIHYNDKLIDWYFGEKGEKLSDEDALAYVNDHGYVCGKRILLRTSSSEGDAYTEEEQAKAKETAETLLSRLEECPPEEQAELFDSLMAEYSEDVALAAYPDGFYFTEGELDAMYDTVLSLPEGGLSGLVECPYGWQIIYRPYMSADHVFETETDGTVYTVRNWAANMLFNAMAEERYEAVTVEYAPGFENLDLTKLFTE